MDGQTRGVEMMTILVTGGSGFMGSNYIYHLIDKNIRVINYSKETYAVHNRTLEKAEKTGLLVNIEGDILDSSKLTTTLEHYEVSHIVHFAAETHVDRSFKYPEEFMQTNFIGTFRLLEVIRHIYEGRRKPVLIHISTDEVFGDVKKGRVKETAQLKPQNPYSASKAAIESLLYAWRTAYGLDIRIIRPTNNYGARQHPEKLIAKVITRCLTNRPYTLWKGDATRNWLYVEDLCNAIDIVMEKGKSGEAYNVSSSDDLTVSQINATITKLMHKEDLFRGYEGQRLKLDQRYALNCDKIRELGWKQQWNFETAILDVIEWYRKNSWFWKGVWSQ